MTTKSKKTHSTGEPIVAKAPEPAPTIQPAVAPAPTPAQPQAPKPVLNDRDMLYVLGEASWLMSRSPAHRHVFMADLEWRLLPALFHGQLRMFRDKSNPIAMVTWALVSDEVDARLKARIDRLQPGDWRSGGHPWIIDVISPFGGADKAVAAVVKDVFGGRPVPVLGGKTVAGTGGEDK